MTVPYRGWPLLGSKLGVSELGVEAAGLAAPKEGVNLFQLQKLRLQLLPGLPSVEQQLAFPGDPVCGVGWFPSSCLLTCDRQAALRPKN